jgi:pimeloyl-ACP methyl ester carboxylesterase/predicted glycosyltransferase
VAILTTPSAVISSTRPEQTRARYPDESGFLVRDGVHVHWERYGDGPRTVLLMPTWQIIHSRMWKAQIPFLARHARVLTFDPRGNGRSDRPVDGGAYDRREFAEDALALLDVHAVERALVVSWCDEGQALLLAANHPARVSGLVMVSGYPVAARTPGRPVYPFDEVLDTDEGWAKSNRHYWLRDWAGYVEFFFSQIYSEPHSTKQVEDALAWGVETDARTLLLEDDPPYTERATALALARRVSCPGLVIQGSEDAITDPADGRTLAEAMGARLVTFDGSGHGPPARDPVRFNLLLRDFADAVERNPPTARPEFAWTRSLARRRRALYLSSPIGLGHAQRDVAIADELRVLRPDLEIDWLAQEPVTTILEDRGERVHPLSRELASESAHFAAESSEHDLNAFQAIRRMDEILVANFMVFHDAVESGEYDLVIGDEAWDVDHFLHENPELKRTAFAWMTDFVGWLPMPAGGEREAFLTADYNAEMIEHVERFPRLRDRAIFVGDPDDIVPDSFGPGLPAIRDWTERHYDFSGYVTGFDPAPLTERREELRREFGYHDDERVVIVTVGGSGVGEALLRRVIAAYPDARRRIPGLRMIAVAGPRIEPASLAAPAGVEVRGYVPRLYEHLAVCDLAVVQGGLTTTMELAAAGRPFLYFPLRNHFEQSRHVRHRLERYGAGRRMEYDESPPDVIAAAMAEEISRPTRYRPVETDGARRAAELIAALV